MSSCDQDFRLRLALVNGTELGWVLHDPEANQLRKFTKELPPAYAGAVKVKNLEDLIGKDKTVTLKYG